MRNRTKSLLIEEGRADKDDAHIKIAEGIQMLDHRQKLIKIVDSSKGGWNTVDQVFEEQFGRRLG